MLVVITSTFAQTTTCKAKHYKSDTFEEVQWTGDVKHGKANGNGTAYFGDGSRFEGTFVKGVQQGKGKFMIKNCQPSNGTNYMIIVSNWIDGKENGETAMIYSPPRKVKNSRPALYFGGNCSAGNTTGTWYAYGTDGTRIGYLKDGNIYADYGLESIVGVLAAIGVGIVGLTAIAAASSGPEMWLLIIIY